MSLSNSQLEEIVKRLQKSQDYQKAAWARVNRIARQYAQMKAFGSYIEENTGFNISVGFNDRKNYEDMFRGNLLRAVEEAFAEDAQMGIQFSKLT